MCAASPPAASPDIASHAESAPAVRERALPNWVTAALIDYLEAVAAALNRRAVAVAGVETTTAELGLVSGRIQLARQCSRDHDHREAVQLRWAETTGWEVTLRPTHDDAVTPWRFLHADLVPPPEHVASFTDGLLRGEELGLRYPASFRSVGNDLTGLAKRLARAARMAVDDSDFDVVDHHLLAHRPAGGGDKADDARAPGAEGFDAHLIDVAEQHHPIPADAVATELDAPTGRRVRDRARLESLLLDAARAGDAGLLTSDEVDSIRDRAYERWEANQDYRDQTPHDEGASS